jgi:uncharacterized membrane protein
MRWMMALFYGAAGFVHLGSPDAFLPIVPGWVPYPHEVILITGVCEIIGAVALLTRQLRWWAGAMLALYAVCVFPANIKHAFENVQLAGMPTSWWYHAPRLAAALPKRVAAEMYFVLDHFRDLAIGMVKDGNAAKLSHDGVKIFIQRLAAGEIEVLS